MHSTRWTSAVALATALLMASTATVSAKPDDPRETCEKLVADELTDCRLVCLHDADGYMCHPPSLVRLVKKLVAPVAT